MRRTLFSLLLLLGALPLFAAPRIIRTINDWWDFTKEGETVSVNIPHCWNADDTRDDTPGYYRGLCTYRKSVLLTEDLSDKNLYVRFEGAYQDATVLVNGREAGRHIGGTTAFCFNITPMVKPGYNFFEVRLDNSHNEAIPPLSADYTFFGGIYRDIELIFTPKVQLSTTHYATSGVYVSTPEVSEAKSRVRITAYLTNATASSQDLTLEHRAYAPDGTLAGTVRTRVKLPAASENVPVAAEMELTDCRLWSPDTPQLYRLETALLERKSGACIDEVANRFGLRYFRFDPQEGFFLNGQHLKLMGTNRHQDRAGIGYALTDEMHAADIRQIKEMGANFLRISHYPQDPVITQMCDALGLVASVEIPIVDYISRGNEAFAQNCLNMVTEMVWQDYNSPSVVIWAYMNEILNKQSRFFKKKDPVEVKRPYWQQVEALAQRLNAAIKALDGGRYTMIPCNASVYDYGQSGIAAVPDILGWNIYRGWYGSDFEGGRKFLEEAHKAFPDKPVIVTEYGAGVDPRLKSNHPCLFDFSAEYGVKFHQYYTALIREFPWVSGSNVWNFNDFYVEHRIDAVPHVNNKGLVGLDRVPKDTYLFYKAALAKTPVVLIGGKDWPVLAGAEGDVQYIPVFSNAPEVELRLNGSLVGRYPVEQYLARVPVQMREGDNRLEAEAVVDGQRVSDHLRVTWRGVPADLRRFREMSVMLGSDRTFREEISGAVWIPERAYTPGGWGYVGGFRPSFARGPVSNQDAFGTPDDPVFQSWREGIESFRADLPDGQYYVWLYLAELSGKRRRFDVLANGERVLPEVNLLERPGAQKALIQKITVLCKNGEGLRLDFVPIEGQPILNAVRIYRCF